MSKKNSQNLNKFFIKKYNSRNSQAHKKRKEIQSQSGASSKSLRQEKCLEHFKELDMVCEEVGCQVAVCSSCILFGSHKNHQYTQVENFLEHVSSVKENLRGVQSEVKRNKKTLVLSHRAENLISKMKNKKKSIERGLTNYCEKLVKRLNKKKEELLSDLKYSFQGLKSKLGKYCEDSVDLINANGNWEETLSGLFLDLESDPQSVTNSFRFLNKIKEHELFLHGQKMLDNFNEMQTHLNQKVNQCLESFSISYEEIGENFFHMHRAEVDFSEDLKQKFQMPGIISQKVAGKNGAAKMQNLKFHEMNIKSGPLDEECFLDDNLDPLGSNLMSSLNLLNEKVINNEFDFNNQERSSFQKEAKKAQTFDPRFPLKERNLNLNFKNSKTEVSGMLRDQMFQKQNLLSSANMDTEILKRHSRNKTSNSNKVFKVNSYHKKSQGRSGTDCRYSDSQPGTKIQNAQAWLKNVEQHRHFVHVKPQQHALRTGKPGLRPSARAATRHERDPVESAADEHQVQ